MPTRHLISEDSQRRVYETRDDSGKVLHRSVEAILSAADQNRVTLTQRAATALQANATYLALPTPTAAQQTQQIDRLTRQTSALIRLVLGSLESAD